MFGNSCGNRGSTELMRCEKFRKLVIIPLGSEVGPSNVTIDRSITCHPIAIQLKHLALGPLVHKLAVAFVRYERPEWCT
jgi:hypothetical protein